MGKAPQKGGSAAKPHKKGVRRQSPTKRGVWGKAPQKGGSGAKPHKKGVRGQSPRKRWSQKISDTFTYESSDSKWVGVQKGNQQQ